jgi:hypothetical protein
MTPLTPLGGGRQLTPLGQARGAGAVTPYSLYFDGSAYVDLGANPSIINLHQAAFTADVYFLCPDPAVLTNYASYCVLAQGNKYIVIGDDGWSVAFVNNVVPTFSIRSTSVDSGGTPRYTSLSGLTHVELASFYIRTRRYSYQIATYVNDASHSAYGGAGGDDASAWHAYIGCLSDLTRKMLGYVCYVHIWNTDKGALGAVPAEPFAVDGNTVARYLFAEGSGAVLTDDSGNGNHGAVTGATWSASVPAGWSI